MLIQEHSVNIQSACYSKFDCQAAGCGPLEPFHAAARSLCGNVGITNTRRRDDAIARDEAKGQAGDAETDPDGKSYSSTHQKL